jgi:hypothetical protein
MAPSCKCHYVMLPLSVGVLSVVLLSLGTPWWVVVAGVLALVVVVGAGSVLEARRARRRT